MSLTLLTSVLSFLNSGIKLVENIPFAKLGDAFQTKHPVLVLGASGTGKTQWLESLSHSVEQAAISRTDRTQRGISTLRRFGTELFSFRDTPGHNDLLRHREVRDAFGGGVKGIINVVSYGYHEGYTGPDLAVTAREEAESAFLTASRAREIEMLQEWSSLLGGAEASRFLLTLVNKADLWWDQREEVLWHYREGAYAQALGEAAHLGPMICSDCAFRKPFYDRVPGSGMFSESSRHELRESVIEALSAAVAKSASKP